MVVGLGRVICLWLGVIEAIDVSAGHARIIGIDGGALQLKDVTGPAAAAGLRPGDVLTHINEQRTFTAQQAMNMVASSQPGQRIKIRGAHPDGKTFTTEAVLEERPAGGGG